MPQTVQKTVCVQNTSLAWPPAPEMANRLTHPRLSCRWLSFAEPADIGERKRTRVDVYGPPQTVLKTAFLPLSASVQQRPRKMKIR